MERKTLTAKIMKEKIKHNFTAEEIATSYNIPIEEFHQTLIKLFGPNACAEFSAQLKQNQKFRAKHPDYSPYAKKDSAQCTDEQLLEVSIHDVETEENTNEVVANLDEVEIIDETDNGDTSLPTTTPTLPELYVLRENTQSALANAELIHKTIVSTRNQIRNDLRLHQENFQKLLEQVINEEKIVDDLSKQLDESEIEMKGVNSQIVEFRKNLSEIDTEIERMQKITIFVYTNSEIDIDSATTIEIPSEWDEIYKQIRDDELLEDFALKQIKALAKVLVLCKQLQAEKRTFEISFESAILDEYFRDTLYAATEGE